MRYLPILFLFTVGVFACMEDTLKRSSVSGYSYELFTDSDGRHPDVGDYVYFQMDIYDDRGEMLQSYRNQRQMPSVRIAATDDEIRKKNPIVDVLSNLSVGDSCAIIIPKDSVPGMPPEYSYVENLLYHVVVEEILDEEAYKQRIDDDRAKAEADAASLRERLPQVQALASETLKSYKNGSLQVQSSPNGVLYTIHEEGAGQLPSKDRMVTVQYYGVLVNEERSFDNSFRAGRGFPFRIGKGEVIPGWDEAIPLLPVGTKASLFIPSELAYGETGFGNEIPPNSELYFYVEIEELFY